MSMRVHTAILQLTTSWRHSGPADAGFCRITLWARFSSSVNARPRTGYAMLLPCPISKPCVTACASSALSGTGVEWLPRPEVRAAGTGRRSR